MAKAAERILKIVWDINFSLEKLNFKILALVPSIARKSYRNLGIHFLSFLAWENSNCFILLVMVRLTQKIIQLISTFRDYMHSSAAFSLKR